MQIMINGQTEKIAPCTIAELVLQKGLKSDHLVIEHNRCIIQQARWPHIRVQEGDTLELLSFVGGG
jgi:sulfur carrier protein